MKIPLPLTTGGTSTVSAILMRPEVATCLFVFGHGAGVPMTHAFMEEACQKLSTRGVATFRYQFPYMERGGRRPDNSTVLISTVRAAVEAAAKAAPDLPLLAGGKSLGGRMTSMAMAESAVPSVRGLVFFGFPLHPARQPDTKRAEHLANVKTPMLFLQGTRDDLADLKLIRRVSRSLGENATLHVVEGADHSFDVLKRSGRTRDEVLDELVDSVAGWTVKLDGANAAAQYGSATMTTASLTGKSVGRHVSPLTMRCGIATAHNRMELGK